MRVGRNPAKTTGEGAVEVVAPPPVSVGLLTHAPYLAGYHSEQLEVIQLAVLSARHHAGRPIHLVVVDNASCPEVRAWLLEALAAGHIDQLVLNGRNLGKVTAMSQILHGSPGPDVVFSDGDLRFHDGWLDAVLAVRAAFPEAGIIGAAPHPPDVGAVEPGEAPPGVDFERGRFISEEDLRAFLHDTGYEAQALEERLQLLAAEEVVRIRRDDVEALVGASHCQFLLTAEARAGLVARVGNEALSAAEDRAYDRALDDLGFLRLSTTSWHYRHVGNRLAVEDRHELERLLGVGVPGPRGGGASSAFWKRSMVRRAMRAVHHTTFRLLYEPVPGSDPETGMRP